jgi:hypothetical protein
MTLLRLIPMHVHAVLETLLAPAIIVAPFVLGFEPAAMVAAVVLGMLLMGTALAAGAALGESPGRGLRVTAHASLDLGFALAALFAAVAFGSAGQPAAGLFFGLVALLQGALATTTRYTTLPA